MLKTGVLKVVGSDLASFFLHSTTTSIKLNRLRSTSARAPPWPGGKRTLPVGGQRYSGGFESVQPRCMVYSQHLINMHVNISFGIENYKVKYKQE